MVATAGSWFLDRIPSLVKVAIYAFWLSSNDLAMSLVTQTNRSQTNDNNDSTVAAMDLAKTLPWLAASVRDIRIMRIEELNDLMPAVPEAK